ncbi:MAG: ATP-dependent sacrificial sulfur transferase LarE [Planctomycetota bacterium]
MVSQERVQRLETRLRALSPVAVALSGGVDSSLLYAEARRVLGEDAVAFVGVSASLSTADLTTAREVATHLEAPLLELSTDELDNPRYRANVGDRCYFCKSALFDRAATEQSLTGWTLCDGSNAEDLASDRPGMQAGSERGVCSPLRDVGFGKEEIRALARLRGLENWNRPARPCLASRVQVGTEVNTDVLSHVEALETVLAEAGFRIYRARIENERVTVVLGKDELSRLGEADWTGRFTARAEALGYRTVLVDLNGYE